MKIRSLTLATGLALFAATGQALAGDLIAMHPFARATAPTAPNGAAFMVLMNASATDLAVVSASTAVAERAELHTHIKDGGVMKMRHVDQIPIPAGQEVVLEPGSFHIMLMGLTAALVEGDSIEVSLTASDGQTLAVSVPVKAAGAMMVMDHGDMDHEEMDSTSKGSSSKSYDSKSHGSSNNSGSGSKGN